jgi:hypothetical protein
LKNFLDTIAQETHLPKMAKIRQSFERPQIPDVRQEVLNQLNLPEITRTLRPGSRIAITAGSRGIANIALVLKTVVSFVKQAGCTPFLFPAMGSHGGVMPQGQREILESFGITPDTVDAPIHCDVQVQELCRLDDGTPVCIDKFAAQADGTPTA